MSQRFFHRFPFLQIFHCPGREACLRESFPNVFYGLVRWVEHIILVETVVAELVVHNLVSGKIICIQVLNEFVGGKKQYRLRQLALVLAILAIANGTYGNNDVNLRIH